jgi:hypothetical protein
MKRMAVCLHDVRLSQGPLIGEAIGGLRALLGPRPITCHLIADAEPGSHGETLRYLKSEIAAGRVEVVFHGVAHRCAPGTVRWLSWYHHDEAEFLGGFDSDLNRSRYRQLGADLGTDLGICPPCWLAGKSGWSFMESLSPPFLEGLLTIGFAGRRAFSPVISLGSRSRLDLFFLKLIASAVAAAAGRLRRDRIRLVIHTTDLDSAKSMEFFKAKYARLEAQGYRAVLQGQLR